MEPDLNLNLSYNKIKPVKYKPRHTDKLRVNPIHSTAQWSEDIFNSIKTYIRKEYYKIQKRRCAYCRRKLNPEGKNEHIDHIIAQSIKKGWMFKPRNLVLACYQCNTQKSDILFTRTNRSLSSFPKKATNYIYFNPFVHNWDDHFSIVDNLFIKAESTLGEDTIEEIKLYRYEYSAIYADEANIYGKTAIERAVQRLYQFDKGSNEYKSAIKLIKEVENNI
jgi:uncharacterized protein (TIGR02646 family)